MVPEWVLALAGSSGVYIATSIWTVSTLTARNEARNDELFRSMTRHEDSIDNHEARLNRHGEQIAAHDQTIAVVTRMVETVHRGKLRP